MEKGLHIYDAMIEITRRCNMKCAHCLRGAAQGKDIEKRYIDTFMSKIDYISSLTITGGEPSLKPEIIQYIIESAKKHNVEIGNFYVATNAKMIREDFVCALMDLYLYCTDNESSLVNWSNDKYHQNDPKAVKLLKILSFAKPKYEQDQRHSEDYILPEGRATSWGKGHARVDYGFDVSDEYIEDGDVYLNVNGEIISGCDWSYKNQKLHKVCNVKDMTIEKFINYKKGE